MTFGKPILRLQLGVLFVFWLSTSAALGAAQPIPMPDADELKEARQEVNALFKAEFKAKKSSKRLALAHQLLKIGQETTDDPATLYVTLEEAAINAAAGGDAKLSNQAISLLEKNFVFNSVPLRLQTLQVVAKLVGKLGRHEPMIDTALQLAQTATASDHYKEAGLAVKIAAKLAKQSGNPYQKARVKGIGAEVKQMHSRFRKVEKSFALLKNKPEDAQANLAVGYFLAFGKADFARGLPLLAKGGTAPLAKLAAAQLAPPQTRAQKLSMGNSWWQAAEKLKAKNERENMLHLAETWYRQAAPDAKPLTRNLLKKRLAKIDAALRKSRWRPDPKLPPGVVAILTFDRDTVARKKGTVRVQDLSGRECHGVITSPDPGSGKKAVANLVPGIAGEALAFTGNQQILTLKGILPGGSGPVTLCVWIKMPKPKMKNKMHIMGFRKGKWGSCLGWLMVTKVADKYWVYTQIRSTYWSTHTGPNNQWQFLTARYDGKSSLQYFSNGSRLWDGTLGVLNHENKFAVGGLSSTYTMAFKGAVDEISIFNRVLSSDEIRQVYKIGKAGKSLRVKR